MTLATEHTKERSLGIIGIITILILCFFLSGTTAQAASKKDLFLYGGKTKTFSAKTYKTVKSSKTSVVSVTKKSKNYVLTAKRSGKATVKLYDKKGKLKTTYAVVVINKSDISNLSTVATVNEGQLVSNPIYIKKDAKFANLTTKGTSSNNKIATVCSNGNIRGHQPGTAVITTKVYYGKKCVKTLKRTIMVAANAGGDTLVLTSYNPSIDSVVPKASSNVRDAFKKYGCTVKVVDTAYYAGLYDANIKVLHLRKGTRQRTAYHELGHFVDSMNILAKSSRTERFQSIYNKEKSAYVNYNKAYVNSSAAEYYAESYAEYVLSNSYLKKTRPLTYDYIKEAIANIK